MALFRYEAIDARGGSVEGQIDADSSQHALQKLGEQALTPTKLEDQSGVSAESAAKAPSILGFAKSA
jgi:type II secretory pathway component PulF